MTEFRIDRVPFEPSAVAEWATEDPRAVNWPVVYTIDGSSRVYVGESIHAATRMYQHLSRPDRTHLKNLRVVIDPTFNKSACLDLESFLIALFAGEGRYSVDNANAGLTGSSYYDRDRYRKRFREIFDALRSEGLFEGSIAQIENSDLFKLSPFKTLNHDQRVAVLRIVERLLDDLRSGITSTAVVQGQPGTGKTIVGIYLMKLLSDIRRGVSIHDSDSDAIFAGFFTPENAALLADFKMGLVVPQQSLRETIRKVFSKTSGLGKDMVLSPFEVGESIEDFDLLVVDEAHRLQQLSATMATLIVKFKSINRQLFHGDEKGGHQLDWIRRRSSHRIFLLDPEQSIRPGSDLPPDVIAALQSEAVEAGRLYPLKTQMRVRANEDYIGYVRAVLSNDPPAEPQSFAEYEFLLFDDLTQMRRTIVQRNHELGLARLVAGFAWRWRSKTDPSAVDIEIDGERLQWNRKPTDWVNSPTAIDEVGSIHTVQGYDLNYAGVIIGPDLRFDPVNRRLCFARDSYFDTKGKQNNAMLGHTYTDEDLLDYVVNIYRVLLSRGIRGTYVYVCDPALRDYLSAFIPSAVPPATAHGSAAPIVDSMAPSPTGRERLAIETDIPSQLVAPADEV